VSSFLERIGGLFARRKSTETFRAQDLRRRVREYLSRDIWWFTFLLPLDVRGGAVATSARLYRLLRRLSEKTEEFSLLDPIDWDATTGSPPLRRTGRSFCATRWRSYRRKPPGRSDGKVANAMSPSDRLC
jgi:hypothetical protein